MKSLCDESSDVLPLHRIFEEAVQRHPESVAVTWGGESIAYGELNRRANRLARYLRGRGVASTTPVGLFLERSVEVVIGILGILKAGGAYAPWIRSIHRRG